MPPEQTATLVDEVTALARAIGARAPAVTALDTPAPMLFVSGLRRPTLVVSRGVLERLDAAERRAALTHELVHVARHDGIMGWALMACRLALAFNPAAHLVARAVVRELEWRADELAVRVSGDRDALDSALIKLSRAGGPPSAAPAPGLVGRAASEIARRGQLAAIAARRQRLHHAQGGGCGLGALRLAGTSGGLVLLLFFVV
jgi:Zn-dependent protease with chaperone function